MLQSQDMVPKMFQPYLKKTDTFYFSISFYNGNQKPIVL